MKKKLLIVGCACLMFFGQAQAMPMECVGIEALAVRLYRAGYTNVANAMFRYLDDVGCYPGASL